LSPVAYQRGFQDRAEAGRLLAQRLAHYATRDDTLVLGLPRGGVPVAFEIAKTLCAPLDVIIVLKLKLARYPELGIGAVAAGGSHVLNDELVQRLGISPTVVADALATERAQLAGRVLALRGDRPEIDAAGAIVILVDDGLATGASMRAAIAAARGLKAARIVVAVPVASREAADSIRQEVDEFVSVICPASFVSVGNWYQSFAQVGDDDVRSLLGLASRLRETAEGGRPT
jgi:putative phosphoribosyl transferase